MIDADQLAHYRKHGYVVPIDVMSVDEAAVLLERLEEAERAFPEALHAENRNNAHLAFPFLAELARDPRIVDVAEAIVGPDISLWSTVLFVKEPNSGAFVSWHQDGQYMRVNDSDNHVTAWLAFTSSTLENGCVSVIPRSHLERGLAHEDTYGTDNILTRGQQVIDVDESSAVHLKLQPGQMSLHNPWLVHGSQPNRTGERRIGIALQTYMGSGVGPIAGSHVVSQIRGNTIDERFGVAPFPDGVNTPQVRAQREAANTALADNLYHGAEHRRSL